ncbi:N-acetylmuramoyl-L-alanine amidase [Corallococcus sp. bb12-1]|uniref:N-acetylmuramoyl-L-alanine amidase n=1 Tax=Corallococcus sp. bb12-1 TaxID=2996784 RepID=UPI002270AC2A|nr:N-acetylmuramoyl-L-alanine amidase [Corallococcus sp. bb12-1]MCY1047263.1 N-acetylmuramoyl-L-alanine amidase [Corallococcus sp. bb12-1]
MSTLRKLSVAVVCAIAPGAFAQSEPFSDARVQPPQLSAPQRGSLVGQYAQTAFGPSEVSRGGFNLPSPLQVPEDRGPLLVRPFPTYSPDGGLSEWGMGWSTALSIQRTRARGELDYTTDELTGPWGRMVKGTDGVWHSADVTSAVRMVASGSSLVAYLPDGGRWIFGAQVRVDTPRGTYAWYLEEARDATGQGTRLDWLQNPSGRPFLERVRYGGRAEDFHYEVTWTYSPLAQAFVDYRSGAPLSLDRRVRQVSLRVQSSNASTPSERWRYALSYQDDDVGPAFQLAQVQQTYASGQQPPATRYTYLGASETLQGASFQATPVLDGVLTAFGADAIQPWQASLVDIDHDGRLDLEHHQRNTLFVQEGNGFRAEELPSADSQTVPECRGPESPYNEPRNLVQLGPDSDAHQVVVLQGDGAYQSTQLTVCTREGRLLDRQTLAGHWELGPNSRLVDLNSDRRPDLLGVYEGGYEILPNVGTDPVAPVFGPKVTGALMPYFTPHTTWVQDLNGDGLSDLVSRQDDGLVVWYGKGQYQFDGTGQGMPVRLSYGGVLSGLLDYQLAFVDLNKDGLSDLVVWQQGFASLFVNTGQEFAEVRAPLDAFFDGLPGPVVVGDLTGTGGTHLTTVRLGQVYSTTLDAPGTGLMRSADDGKGTVLGFQYAWSPPAAGSYRRESVLAALDVTSSGHAPEHITYGYSGAVMHPVSKALLGYEAVTRATPVSTEAVTFSHDAQQTGLLVSSTSTDARSPGVERFESRVYDVTSSFGLPWKRLREQHGGWRSGTTQVEQWTEFQAYAADLCPARTVLHTVQGTLTTEHTRASPSGLAGHLHCLDSGVVLTGQHADASLDFRHESRLTRNAVGLLEKLESVGPSGAVTLQDVAYRPDFSVERVSAPGRGTTWFDFEQGGTVLRKVTSPDGTSVEVTGREPLTDDVRSLRYASGTASYSESFRYDGQERLVRQWDDQGHATETNPSVLMAYQYATALKPALVEVESLVDAYSGAKRQLAEWSTAAGESVTRAQRIPGGWAFQDVSTFDPGQLETRTYARPGAPDTLQLAAVRYTDLLAGTASLSLRRGAGFGHALDVSTFLQTGVEQQVHTTLTVEAGGVRRDMVENGTQRTTVWSDAALRVRMFQDPEGTQYQYTYDVLGRVRGVLLPDGRHHQLTVDAHGRVATVAREGIATVEYTYDALTGLPTSRLTRGASGTARRSEGWSYDDLGRKTLEVHTDLSTGATQRYRSYYDGATAQAPNQRTQLGQLSGVSGEGFEKTFEYRADGSVARRVVRLTGWRTVETLFAYNDGGDVVAETTRVLDANGLLLSTHTEAQRWDAHGRRSETLLDGVPLALYGYDGNNQPVTADFATAGRITLGHDPLTRRTLTKTQQGPGWTASVGQQLDARGFVAEESFSSGGVSVSRQYGYSHRGFLTQATEGSHSYDYGFDPAGLPTLIAQDGVQRVFSVQGNVLTAGSVAYTFDDLGRTVSRGDTRFEYGPHGQVARVVRDTSEWRFLYDESGQRLLKLVGSTPQVAYLDGGRVLDVNGLTKPFRFAGQVVGLVHEGTFQLLGTDARGSVMADADGQLRLASPFGARTTRPVSAAVVDFVEKGYDADLGLVRMGARDYDPELNRFLTPDPLFLEQPMLCVESPVECNLYAYARNAPTRFVDPSGFKAKAAAPAATAAPLQSEVIVTPYLIERKYYKSLEHGTLTKVNAIVLHRTSGPTGQSALSGYHGGQKTGAHFLVDENGKITQTAALGQMAWHTGPLRAKCSEEKTCSPAEKKTIYDIEHKKGQTTKQRWLALNQHELAKSYPDRYPSNEDSIGIEVVGVIDSTGGFPAPSQKQIDAVRALVNVLQAQYNLTAADVHAHGVLSYRDALHSEGTGFTY